MIAVTEVARLELKSMLETSADDPEVCFRLELDSNGKLSLAMDKEHEGDEIVEHDGVKIMLVDTEISRALDGIVIEARDCEEGRNLVARKA